MDETLAKNMKGIPSDYKILMTKNKHIQKHVLSLVKDQKIVIIENETFDSEMPVCVTHQGKEILAKTYSSYERTIILASETSYERTIILASETMETITDFIDSCNKKAVSDGYLLYQNGDAINIIDDVKFEDMFGIDSIKDLVIKDIDRYLNNIHKYRKMGNNRGINYILHSTSGLGKTSFCRALASYYHAHLFKTNTTLNPIKQGLCIVMVDDCNYIPDSYLSEIYDNGRENVIRFFITNNLNSIQKPAFMSRCRRVLEFPSPSSQSITSLIINVFDVPEAEARPLASIIEQRDNIRKHKYYEMEKQKLQAKKIADKKEEDRTEEEIIKPFVPLSYRDLNYFLADFIGDPDPINTAIQDIDHWIESRGKYMSNASSSECVIL
jgi:hypothetical protein